MIVYFEMLEVYFQTNNNYNLKSFDKYHLDIHIIINIFN